MEERTGTMKVKKKRVMGHEKCTQRGEEGRRKKKNNEVDEEKVKEREEREEETIKGDVLQVSRAPNRRDGRRRRRSVEICTGFLPGFLCVPRTCHDALITKNTPCVYC